MGLTPERLGLSAAAQPAQPRPRLCLGGREGWRGPWQFWGPSCSFHQGAQRRGRMSWRCAHRAWGCGLGHIGGRGVRRRPFLAAANAEGWGPIVFPLAGKGRGSSLPLSSPRGCAFPSARWIQGSVILSLAATASAYPSPALTDFTFAGVCVAGPTSRLPRAQPLWP